MKRSTWAKLGGLVVVGGVLAGCGSSGGSAPAGFASSDCASTYQMKSNTPATGQWILGGVKAIKDAKTPAQAKQAAQVWRQDIRVYPSELARASFDLTGVMPDADQLVYTDGCATPDAVTLDAHLQSVLNAAQITPSTVPGYFYNSLTKNGAVLSESGVSGSDASRKAVRIEVPSGIVTTAAVSGSGVSKASKTVYAMARCGNGATQAPAPVSPPAKHPKKAPKQTPTPTPSASTPTSTPSPSASTSTPTPTPTPTKTHCDCGTPTPTPSESQCGCSSSPPPTCQSEYGPGYTGTYPNCYKDGSTAPSPDPSNSAPGQNPSPSSSGDPGSNACYDPQTGNPCTS